MLPDEVLATAKKALKDGAGWSKLLMDAGVFPVAMKGSLWAYIYMYIYTLYVISGSIYIYICIYKYILQIYTSSPSIQV